MANMFPGSQSGVINGQLVPIFPISSYLPPSTVGASMQQGTGVATLPGPSIGGSAKYAGQSANTATTAPAASTESTVSVGPFGIPTIVLWVLIGGGLAYLVLWKIHFRTGATASVGD